MTVAIRRTGIKIGFKKLNEEAIMPKYSRVGDACLDISSIEEIVLEPGDFKSIKTGLGIELPANTEALVRPRSGLAAKHGITVLNTPGTIDENFKGEIGVILINHGKESFKVEKGMRIAQLAIKNTIDVFVEEVNELSDSNRGENGFGSSGLL